MTDRAVLPALARPTSSRTGRLGVWLDEHARTIALAAVGVSVMIAGGYALFLGGELRFYDEQVYVSLTRSLAHGHGFTLDGVQPTAYRPPGYVFALLPVYLASGGSVLAMRMVGVLALAGSAWFAYLIGRRAHAPATGALAAVVVACYPLLIYTATTLYPQVPALFLLLAMIETGLRALPADGKTGRHRLLMALLSGLLGGVLTLTVPTFGVTVVGFVLWLMWRQRRARGRIMWRSVAVVIVAAAVLPVVWSARNEAQLHTFVPVSTNDGVNLLLGNSPNATPDSGTNTDISTYETIAKQRKFGEVQLDHFYTGQALKWIKENPGHAAVLYAEKVANNFSYHDDLATSGQHSALSSSLPPRAQLSPLPARSAQDLVSALSFYPILALALLRVVLFRRFPLRPEEKLLLGTIVVNVLLLAVFFTRLRFRVPLDALTIILAASMVTQFLLRRTGKQLDPEAG